MKLYKVEVVYQTVILAENEKEAECKASHIVRREDDGDPINMTTEEIFSLAQLPDPWGKDCRPWGERDAFDRTIGEILIQNQ